MYIACAADKIYAGPASATGSVGTLIGPFFNLSDLMSKVGVAAETITAGLNKDMMSPFRPWKPGEDSSLKNLVAYFYQQFVDLVAASRPRMDKTKLVEVYGAQIYDPVTAEQLGYVDVANASRGQALLDLLKEAGIDPSAQYQVVELDAKSGWRSLFGNDSPLRGGTLQHLLGPNFYFLKNQFAYLYQP
jgi:ClpP class serine protease